jgi:hypothetical protein
MYLINTIRRKCNQSASASSGAEYRAVNWPYIPRELLPYDQLKSIDRPSCSTAGAHRARHLRAQRQLGGVNAPGASSENAGIWTSKCSPAVVTIS